MAKGVYAFLNGNVKELNEKDFTKEIIDRQIEKMYIRIKEGERHIVRVYDSFSAEPYSFEEYFPSGVFILQKKDEKETKFAREILRENESLLVALLNGEDVREALTNYGREGDAVSELEENPEKPVRRAA